MAGDWIKMRVGLVTHPKVMRMAEALSENGQFLEWAGLSYRSYPPISEADARNERYAALRVTRYVTVTALLRFWGYANEHSKGEELLGVYPQDVDEIAGVPGFAAAFEEAGWGQFGGCGGLLMRNFNEHNTPVEARSSGAERQQRYRNRKRGNGLGESSSAPLSAPLSGQQSDVTRDVTVTHREEKKREEKKEKKSAAEAALLAGLPEQLAADFLAIRKAKRLPLTPTAADGMRREAEKAGLTVEQMIRTCCERGWGSFEAKWLDRDRGAAATAPSPPRKTRPLL
ncbi:MAG TPA: hypothetical protein VFS20_29570 [Longimicrobium sp.]|nr:hypothetical protein [Longimicrobium sp.]